MPRVNVPVPVRPAGGFAKAATGKDINFMIVQKSAVIQYPKHTVNKVVTPEDNQTDDRGHR